MSRRPAVPLLALIRRFVPPPEAETSDRQLLRRFVADRDGAAFAALVERHGPMVMAVCRCQLGNVHDAEDAFQAAFLVLARKAGSVGRPEQLANWLYGVAWRTASRARVAACRRRKHEQQAALPALMPTAHDPEHHELQAVLDEELSRLPTCYRAPVVLCYLEGKTRADAARQLGWTEGMVRGRLERARDKLRARLARRGLAVPAGALAAVLAEGTSSAAVPAALVEATAQAALLYVAGLPAAGLVSPHALTLTREVLKAMFLTKLKLVTGMLLAIGLLGTGGIAWRQAASGQPAPTPKHASPPGAPQAEVKTKEPTPPTATVGSDPWDALDQRATLSFEPNTTLMNALEHISSTCNVTLLIDAEAFKSENIPEVESTPIRLSMLRGARLRTALRLILSQASADFLAQDDLIRIVPQSYITTGRALRQSVAVTLRGGSLDQAFRDLAHKTGVSIVFDEQLAQHSDAFKTPLTIQLESVPLIAAVAVLANMRNLIAIPLDNMIYVTTPEKADGFRIAHPALLREPSSPPASEPTTKPTESQPAPKARPKGPAR